MLSLEVRVVGFSYGASQESHSGEVFPRVSASSGEDVLRSACISLVLERRGYILRCSVCERSGHIWCVAWGIRTVLQSTWRTRLAYVGCGI